MEMENRAPELQETLRSLWKHRILIAVSILVVTGIALTYSLQQREMYKASSHVVIRPIVPDAAFGRTWSTNSGVLGMDFSVETQAQILSSEVVASRVIRRLGLGTTRERLLRSVRVNQLSDEVLEVVARAPTSRGAADVANAFVEEYLDYRQDSAAKLLRELGSGLQKQQRDLSERADDLDARIVELFEREADDPTDDARREADIDRLRTERNRVLEDLGVIRARAEDLAVGQQLITSGGDVVKAALPPRRPDSPQPLRDGAVGLLLGMMLGVGLAMVRSRMDEHIHTHAEATWAAGVPVIGTVPRVPEWRRKGNAYLVSTQDPGSPAAEAYRTIRQTLAAMGLGKTIKTVVVTSGGAGAGKSSTAANLAVVSAQAGMRTVLISADLRRPRLHEFFQLPNGSGLGPALAGRDKNVVLRPTKVPNLRVLPSGPAAPRAGELLDQGGMREILEAISADADVVILDAPPLASGADPLALSSISDLTLLCMRQKRARSRATGAAVDVLNRAGAGQVLGVLTVASDREGDGRGYGYKGAYDYRRAAADASRVKSSRARHENQSELVIVNPFGPADEPRPVRTATNGHPKISTSTGAYDTPRRRWRDFWGESGS